MSLSGDIISDMELDASIEAIGEIAGNIDLDGSGSTPTITASATVSPDPGIPACDVVKTGTDEYPNFAFNFSGLKGEPGEQGAPGQNGQNGADGSDGVTPNLTATASVGASTGTPAVTVTRTGTDENPNFYFQFDNLKGEQGIQGIQGETGSQGAPGTVPNVSASASVTNTSGTPAVTVTRTGSDANPNFDFAFENLKGEQGIQGIPGQNGQNGADGSDGVTPIISATASVDDAVGIPNVVITRSGTDAAPNYDFAFHNLKGNPGQGVPSGGSTGQVLAKQSSTDYDAAWKSLTIPSTAAEISFDNTGTGMSATDVQDAVTELKSNLTQLNGLNVVKRITTPATVVSFSDGSNLPMYKLLLSIEPVQEGSGDPSPENIRPISGFTEANVVVSPTTDAEDGTTYNIQFKDGSNPLTVYGGTLDVVSGELKVDRASVDLGTLNWGYASERVIFYTQNLSTVIFKPGDDKTAKTLCSAYRYVSYRDFSNNTVSIGSPSGMLYIKDTHYTNATAFKTAMNGVQLVYELAAPITYQLTPTQVNSLLGSNNVWADTGDILEVDYTAILNFS